MTMNYPYNKTGAKKSSSTSRAVQQVITIKNSTPKTSLNNHRGITTTKLSFRTIKISIGIVASSILIIATIYQIRGLNHFEQQQKQQNTVQVSTNYINKNNIHHLSEKNNRRSTTQSEQQQLQEHFNGIPITSTSNQKETNQVKIEHDDNNKVQRENSIGNEQQLDVEKQASLSSLLESDFYIIDNWDDHIQQTIQYSQRNTIKSIIKYITAYIEPYYINNTTIPGTGSRGNYKNDKDIGVPPKFIIPMPLRTNTPNELYKIVYNNNYNNSIPTCYDMPNKFPVDRGLQYDENGNIITWNVGNTPPKTSSSSSSYPFDEAQYCPVEADPFLPWIHDVFPQVTTTTTTTTTTAGTGTTIKTTKKSTTSIHIIAQNRRKCQTGSLYTEYVNRLVPQVTLLQSISVQRINESYAQQLAPSLWTSTKTSTKTSQKSRYRLVPYDEADPDGMYTRFICQFHTTVYNNNIEPEQVLVGETLSRYPFNYEMVSYRKGQTALLTPKGKDTTFFWTSNLHFECPIPESLQTVISTGKSILPDTGIPTIYLDIIPIRSDVRYSELYLTEDMIGPKQNWGIPSFDPYERWGTHQVLPRIEASGRWTNIPICWIPQQPPVPTTTTTTTTSSTSKAIQNDNTNEEHAESDTSQSQRQLNNTSNDVNTISSSQDSTVTKKVHYLSACLWASATFKTRGIRKGGDTATTDRLLEWIEFHLMVGFDHIYVYDNSGAHSNDTSLRPVTDQFDPAFVSRIDWPSSICNNNIPAADSTGERSTQYAAENSCRTRYGPYTDWIAVFDTDEYFVPMGNYTNLKDVLYDISTKEDVRILSFRSTRGRLRLDHSTIDTTTDITNPNYNNGFDKSADALFLQAYNCDSTGSPKPSWGDRARKQIYQSDYVLYHFVHYSTVTSDYMITYKNATDIGKSWSHRYHEKHERTVNELTEAVMVHTKTLTSDHTKNWQDLCRYDYPKEWKTCWAARPWPINTSVQQAEQIISNKNNKNINNNKHKHRQGQQKWYDDNGYKYNCFINPKVEYYWLPKLREAVKERKKRSSLTKS